MSASFEGDAEHRVAFSSVNQNEQLVAVVGPGQLAMELEKTSGIAVSGKSLTIPLRVKRGLNLKGEVKVALIVPAHIRGVRAEPLTIAPGGELGTLTIHFAAKVEGPFNMPLLVRATLMESDRPVVAEASLDVQP